MDHPRRSSPGGARGTSRARAVVGAVAPPFGQAARHLRVSDRSLSVPPAGASVASVRKPRKRGDVRMPTYLSPGVYMEEVVRVRSRSRASARRRPPSSASPRGAPPTSPTLVTNWTQFTQTFGDFVEGSYLAHAVYGYFLNGGGVGLRRARRRRRRRRGAAGRAAELPAARGRQGRRSYRCGARARADRRRHHRRGRRRRSSPPTTRSS